MVDEQRDKIISLIKAFVIGIVLDACLLAIIYMIRSLREAFIVVLVVVVAHLVCSVGLVLYRAGDELREFDFDFIRFGPLAALWQVLW